MIYLDALLAILPMLFLYKYRCILIKITLIIGWYPILIMLLFKYGIPMSGILHLERDVLGGDVIAYAFYSYLTGFYLFCMILYGIRNKEFTYKQMRLPPNVRTFILILCILFAIPVLNIHSGEKDNMHSATLYLFVNSIMLISFAKKDWKWTIQLCLYSFLILSGERVDSILLIVLLFLLINRQGMVGFSYNKKYLVVGGFLFFIILVAVGSLRGGGNISTELIFSAIYSQQTVCDVVYVFLTGVRYVIEKGTAPIVLLNLLGGLIPGETMGVTSPYNYNIFIGKYMTNPGGGLYCTEGYLALGFIGPILYFCIYGWILKKLFLSKYRFDRYIFLLFIIMQCRIVWYGMAFIYKPLVLLYLGLFFLKKFEIHTKIAKHIIRYDKKRINNQ